MHAAMIAGAWDGKWIVGGQPISAASLKADLKEFDDRLKAIEAARPVYQNNGKKQYLDAKYCGLTAPVTGNIGGRVAANQLCIAAPGCNASPTVHMCTPQEILRFVGTGGAMPPKYLRINTGGFAQTSSGAVIRDCDGWHSQNSMEYAVSWGGPNETEGQQPCSDALEVACCD